jgi:orotidine-5'-phosphate decarboxylase
MTFGEKLDAIVSNNNSLLCVGLDSGVDGPQFPFNKAIIDATHDLVCAYKPNTAFYEARGTEGIEALKQTCDYLRETYPQIPIILDAKRADIGSTNEGYVTFAFDYLGTDAITLHPYLGREALKPFLDRKDRGCIILCKTSNPGSGEFQDVLLSTSQSSEASAKDGKPFYQVIAEHIAREWNTNGNCALVVGATYPTELQTVRAIVGDMPLLIPGVGAQGADVEQTVKAGVDRHGKNAIINASRSVILASDPRKEAEHLRDQINLWRTT